MKSENFNKNTVSELLFKRSTQSPNDVAYIFPELDKRYTWLQVWKKTRTLAEGLIGIAVKNGDRVAVLMEDSLESIVCMYAAAFIGAVVVPINAYSKKEELKAYLNDALPVVMLMSLTGRHQNYADIVHELISEDVSNWRPAHIFVQSNSNKIPHGFSDFKQLFDEANRIDDDSFLNVCNSVNAHDPIFLLHTSGTTGSPKAVVRTSASFILVKDEAELPKFKREVKQAVSKVVNTIANRVSMMTLLPLYHLGGISVLFTTLKSSNIRLVMLSHFNPINAVHAIKKNKCQLLAGTPFMIQHMFTCLPEKEIQLNSLLGIAFTSSAVNGPILEKIIPAAKKLLFFIVSYGSSEAGSVANSTCVVENKSVMTFLLLKLAKGANMLNGLLPYDEFFKTQHSIGGKIDKNVEVRIINPDTGEFLPGTQEGEIIIRSKRVMRYSNPNFISESFLSDGWYKSGDLGFINDKGFLIITGRTKRAISRGGEKISPAEVENAILNNPDIANAYVLGVPDELYGEQLCAVYVPKNGIEVDIDSLKKELSKHLSQFKVPKYFIPVPNFPLSPTGKISGEEMKKLVLQKL